MRTFMLARVPVIFLLILVLLASLSLFSGIQPTFLGLFTLETFGSMFLVALAACSISLGATASINLVLAHGNARTSRKPEFPPVYPQYEPKLWLYLLCQVPAIFFVACCVRLWPHAWISAILPIAAGWAAAHVVLALAVIGEILLADPCSELPNMLVLPLPQQLRDEGKLAERLLASDPLPWARRLTDWFANLLANYALPLLPGYLYLSGNQFKLYPGMILNAVFSFIAVVLWVLLIWYAVSAASLAFVLLALLIFLLLFAGAAFFLDRYRFPLSLAVLAYALLVGTSPGTDHLYRVDKPQQGDRVPEFAKPCQVLSNVGTPVVIMTAGGGIQAAAWTTQVLAGLEARAKSEGVPFSNRIVLISSISGGSVGAYYTAVAYHDAATNHGPVSLEQARDSALQPALDEIAWGWTGPDLMRVFLPYAWHSDVDRGWALENKWDQIAGAGDFYLDDLAKDTGQGAAPAFIMNATAIEDGTPFIFASTAFGENGPRDPALLRDVKEFNQQNHHQLRVRVSTAARLSASFPYVAPAARSNGHPLAPDYHLVDGGYYDNFGIRSALDWLTEANLEGAVKPDKIALVQIRWGDPADVGGSIRGWSYQGSAPLSGVLNVRSQGQLRDDDVALQVFHGNWKGATDFQFAYNGVKGCEKQPLSWKFTTAQRDCLATTWSHDQKIMDEATRLVEFLK